MIYKDKPFLHDTYLHTIKTNIIKSDIDENQKPYVLFNSTIFHPQGGGQPTDTGFVIINNDKFFINMVKQIGNEIRHYTESILPIITNVHMEIDSEKRLLFSRLHTAGHLLDLAQIIFPKIKAIKGHQFPNEAYIEFTGEIENTETASSLLENKLNELILNKINVKTFYLSIDEFEKEFPHLTCKYPDQGYIRLVQIGDWMPIPCGGTHVTNISEIKGIKIRKISSKKGLTKIGYDIL
jgi:alanyl-tRNA synthetase